jgi:hypothetical protein
MGRWRRTYRVAALAARFARKSAFTRVFRRAMRGNNPARRGRGRGIVRRGAQDEPERVAGRGRERKPPRRHLIDVAGAQLADDDANGAAAHRFFHRPQHVAAVRGGDRDQVLGSAAAFLEAGSIGHAVFGEREILGDPEHASSCRGRAIAARRQRQRKAGGGGGLRLTGSGDLVQRTAAESATEGAINQRNAERQRRAFTAKPGCHLHGAQLLAQSRDEGRRSFGGGSNGWSQTGHGGIRGTAGLAAAK